MTMPHDPLSELGLDLTLRAFLGDGPEAPVQRIADRALDAIRDTPQVRPPLVRRWARRSWPVLAKVGLGAAVIVVVVAVGLSIATLPTGPARPTASPASSPSPVSRTVSVGSAADGYRLTLPRAWTEEPADGPDARRWVGDEGEVMVSYGASIFDGGAITLCGPPTPEWPTCGADSFKYSIPYDPEHDGVGPLSMMGFVRDRCEGGCAVTTSRSTLGGELAEVNRTLVGGTPVTYVSTFHQQRPVVLYIRSSATSPGDAPWIDEIRASFAFIDTPIASPTAFVDPTELVPYVNTEIGYEMLVPRFWGEGADPVGYPGMHTFANGQGFATETDPALTISVGAPDGAVTVCQDNGRQCQDLRAKTIADLDRVLVSVPSALAPSGVGETSGELTLDGIAGHFRRPDYHLAEAPNEFGLAGTAGGNCLGCPAMLYHAYTVKDGRPIVISIDWWTVAFEELPPDYLATMLASFRLLD